MRVDLEEYRASKTVVSPEAIDRQTNETTSAHAGCASLMVGAELDARYRLLRHIGSGGMGHVYEAEDRSLGRRVAIKALKEEASQRERGKQRLVREARLAARVQHPNIVRVYELGSARGVDYVVMELLDGEDLQARIRNRGPLPIDFVERLGRCLASALVAMHDAGVVHRDIKPGNLFLARNADEQDVLKVLDFGVAKGGLDASLRCTQTGRVFGTLAYMAPEQLRGATLASPQSDIWSAGGVLYEALTGHLPFEADSIADLVAKIAGEAPAPVERQRPDVPAHLVAAIRRALSKDPAVRFESARAFHAALTNRRQQVSCAVTQPWSVESLCTNTAGAGSQERAATDSRPAHRFRHVWPVLALFAALLLVSGWIRWLVSAPADQSAASAALSAYRPILESLPDRGAGSR